MTNSGNTSSSSNGGEKQQNKATREVAQPSSQATEDTTNSGLDIHEDVNDVDTSTSSFLNETGPNDAPSPQNEGSRSITRAEHQAHFSANESQYRTRGPDHGTVVPENTDDREVIDVLGDRFLDRKVTSNITISFKRHFDGAWPTWQRVPSQVKDELWDKFTLKWRWAACRTREIKKAWHKTNVTRFRDVLWDERRKAAKKAKSNNPIDWRGFYPDWIGTANWNKLIDETWSTKDWSKKSVVRKNSRIAPNKGALQIYTGGSIPSLADKRKLDMKLKRKATEFELYDRTHESDKGTREYISSKAKRVHERYDENLETTGHAPDLRPSFDSGLWRRESGGTFNGRLYGCSSSQNVMDMSGSSYDRSSKQGTNFHQLKIDEKFDGLEKRIEEMKEKNDRAIEQMNKFRQELPNLLRAMLQDIGFSNHAYAGGSGYRQRDIFNNDSVSNDDKSSEEDSF